MIAAFIWLLTAAPMTVSGLVHDSSGGAVAGAAVIVRTTSGPERQTVTGADGRFTIEVADAGEATLIVRAGGFAEKTQRLSGGGDVDVQVEPAAVLETVTVTPSRSEQKVADIPASVDVYTGEEMQQSPALIADDALRNVASFSLFRRTSSIAAQPTTQGVSLRGIGPSGQSRTLVLLDGVPFNDPFGGWVYWTRVPMESVDRVEITEDASSSLYGNVAMGGVINIITAHPAKRTVEVKPEYGNDNTPKFDFFGSDQWDKVGAAIEGSFLRTDGFPIVEQIERGPIDNNANVAYKNITGKLEFTPSDRLQGFFRAGYFSENRNNAKIGELNDTRWTTVNGGIRARMPDDSDFLARVFADDQHAHFNFLAVTNSATLRNIVRLATDQLVPETGVGAMAQWSKAFGARNLFTAGFDVRHVTGESQESAYVASTPTVIDAFSGGCPANISCGTQHATLSVQRFSGGSQLNSGAYVQDIFTPIDKLVVTLSARVDGWNNSNGHNLETTFATGLPTANNKPSIAARNDTVVSPHVGVLYHATDQVSVWGAANSGFRAPTLTELYRQFAVGPVTTFPNSDLAPERLVGGEVGVNVVPVHNTSIRLTWFGNQITNPVLNVTQVNAFCSARAVPAGCAQKLNVPQTTVRGIQAEAEVRVAKYFRFGAGYVYDNATVTDGGTLSASLNGKWLQQVPRNRGTFQASYSDSRVATVALNMQFLGLAYNDDLNVNFVPPATLADAGYTNTAFPAGLPGYTVSDLSVSRNIGRNLQAFFGVQNLFNTLYFVQTNPSTIGTPRLVNGGVRVRFSGR
ncbi:MAG TPA: TonB-dependent receptor [Vicinamibacterales bacterium]|nr:TonB-dependent receptor [Vicinamibacterales bacterium]